MNDLPPSCPRLLPPPVAPLPPKWHGADYAARRLEEIRAARRRTSVNNPLNAHVDWLLAELERAQAQASDDELSGEARCVGCGCTENSACPGGCHWVPAMVDICSACVPLPDSALIAAERQPGDPVHGCPPDGGSLMPCCQRTPYEVPKSHRITLDPALVTCPGFRQEQP